MTQQPRFRVYTKKDWKQGLEEIFICPCSRLHYSQQQKGRSNASVHRRVNKMQSTHTMEYYSAVKEGSSDPHSHMDDLEDIMLGETSQSQKDIYCVVPFM